MKLTAIAILLCLALPSLAAQNQNYYLPPQPGTDHCPQNQDWAPLKLQLEQRLQLWETHFIPQLKRGQRAQARNLVVEIRALLGELTSNQQFQPWQPYSPLPLPIAPADFETLRQTVKKAVFSDDMLGVLRLAAEQNGFTARQIAELIRLFVFDSDKLEALEILWPRCLEPGNKFMILDCFTYSYDRDAALEILNRR